MLNTSMNKQMNMKESVKNWLTAYIYIKQSNNNNNHDAVINIYRHLPDSHV